MNNNDEKSKLELIGTTMQSAGCGCTMFLLVLPLLFFLWVLI